jgi:glycerophosphoryl diester phosphodiesterase
MPAFEGAVRLGYEYVETDVHLTADGVLVAFHDDVLDRVTDRRGAIADMPWSAVREARVDGVEPIPLLEDLLGAFPSLRVNIEPKSDAAVGALAETLQRCDAIDRVLVCSFVDRRVAMARERLGPALCTGLGQKGVAKLIAASRGLGRPRFAEAAAQVPPSHKGIPIVTRRFVDTAHGLGLAVHVWTIDEPDEMDRLLDLGVDGIMTDRPSVLRDVLRRRGEWTDGPEVPGPDG